uniref:BLOC-1-related complex subunit 5 n=1 Tax=Steinernema glaseri TaxID=37863 RepID=A0A1I8A3C5_9BILA
MGNEQSSSSGAVPSSISFLAGKRGMEICVFTTLSMLGTTVKRPNQIVVVRPGQDAIGDPADDPEIKKLQEIRRFLPILKSSLAGMRDSPEVFSKVGSKPIMKFCYRIQEHLSVCAKKISSEQAAVQSKMKHVEHTTSVAVSKYQDAVRHTDKFSDILSTVKMTSRKMIEVENLLRSLVPLAEELGRLVNEVLPQNQHLPHLDLAKILDDPPSSSGKPLVGQSEGHVSTVYSGEQRESNANVSSGATTSSPSTRLTNHIMPIEEHRVIDRYSLK